MSSTLRCQGKECSLYDQEPGKFTKRHQYGTALTESLLDERRHVSNIPTDERAKQMPRQARTSSRFQCAVVKKLRVVVITDSCMMLPMKGIECDEVNDRPPSPEATCDAVQTGRSKQGSMHCFMNQQSGLGDSNSERDNRSYRKPWRDVGPHWQQGNLHQRNA